MAHARILSTDTPTLFEQAVAEASDLLQAGEVVALPTETVYGLAANALDVSAVERIFEIKGRPSHNPIIVHVNGLAMAKSCAGNWPDLATQLAHAFWPGPLTLILPKSEIIPDVVTAGGETVGIRWPSHPLMQAVIRKCGFPLAAPSANRSNELSSTNARHVQSQLGDQLKLIVDGGQSQIGIESTVLDLTSEPPRLLRPGMIHEEALLAVTEQLALGFGDRDTILKSPGLFPKHYAPKARLVLMSWHDDEAIQRQLSALSIAPESAHVVAHTHIPSSIDLAGISVIPHDAEAFARALYAELHRCDATGVETIVVESVPDRPEWRAVADRLRRASAR